VVKIRSPLPQLEHLLPLSGKKLDLAGHLIRIGTPQLHTLSASADLSCNLVTIKGYLDAGEFASGVRKQLDSEGISSSVNVVVGRRRVLRIKQQTIVGFEVRLQGLSDEESLAVQQKGIGGRRHLGCGLFNPSNPSPQHERELK
jgi:CRISPR-associated endonuclease/helicase Cas3